MTKEKIDELKKANPAGVFKGEISFFDECNKIRKLDFIFRAPTTADMEAHVSKAQKNPIVANLNIIQSLILDPEPAKVIDVIQNYPVATNKFCEEVILPFFGSSVNTSKEKL